MCAASGHCSRCTEERGCGTNHARNSQIHQYCCDCRICTCQELHAGHPIVIDALFRERRQKSSSFQRNETAKLSQGSISTRHKKMRRIIMVYTDGADDVVSSQCKYAFMPPLRDKTCTRRFAGDKVSRWRCLRAPCQEDNDDAA